MGAPELLIVAGTRPEAIKVAPVVLAADAVGLRVEVLATGQHTDLLDGAFAPFGIQVDHRIEPTDRPTGSQAHLFAHLLPALDRAIGAIAPGAVLVQGDTASALAGAQAAFWRQVPVVHLEAGLRSFDLANPFPEEAYRRSIAPIASLHLAPTPAAVENLRREGVASERILCIGNTVVDAARHAATSPAAAPAIGAGRRLVLLTVHRRENWGDPLRSIARAVRRVVEETPDIEVVVPLHPNPLVRSTLTELLGGHDRIRLIAALDHPSLMAHLRAATMVLTDSGGIQEEAPAFGTPVLVLRSTTERPEAVAAGCARLVGTDEDEIARRATDLLTDELARRRMARIANPFGDGRSGRRAVDGVRWTLGVGPRPAEWVPSTPSPLPFPHPVQVPAT